MTEKVKVQPLSWTSPQSLLQCVSLSSPTHQQYPPPMKTPPYGPGYMAKSARSQEVNVPPTRTYMVFQLALRGIGHLYRHKRSKHVLSLLTYRLNRALCVFFVFSARISCPQRQSFLRYTVGCNEPAQIIQTSSSTTWISPVGCSYSAVRSGRTGIGSGPHVQLTQFLRLNIWTTYLSCC